MAGWKTLGMVGVGGVLVVACSAAETDVVGETKSAQIVDIASMAQRPDGKFNVVCKDGSTEIATAADIARNRVCEPGTPPPDPGPSVLLYGRSDSCSDGDAVVRVNASTDCATLSDTEVSWSVKKDGACINISDTTLRGACLEHQPGAETRTLIYTDSDSCNGVVGASVTNRTSCPQLSDATPAWSVKKNGTCVNISDTNLRAACLEHQPGAENRTLVYADSDSCRGVVVASLGPRTDCSKHSDSAPAWSVKKNGACINIADTNVRGACLEHQPGSESRVLIYSNSDSCNGIVVASVDTQTDCQTLGDSTPAWSVKKNGACINISDTNVRAACLSHQ
ncbi:MAG: hypothetical protein U0169_26855 [Polyangiaceae bacterium]